MNTYSHANATGDDARPLPYGWEKHFHQQYDGSRAHLLTHAPFLQEQGLVRAHTVRACHHAMLTINAGTM